MNEHIHVFALGGLDENGKNLTVVRIDDDIFVIDAGVKHPDKSTPGVDYIIPDYSYLVENKHLIRAYIITHGHDDQLGALAYILPEAPAPIYCTDVTRIFIESFLSHVSSNLKPEFNIIKPTSIEKIANRTVRFFATCHSMPRSFGVAIETSAGNIVYTSDFIIENNSFKNFSYDSNAVGAIAEKETLLLMNESTFATKTGYTTPRHRLTPLIQNIFENEAKGRIFISVFSTNAFSIAEIIRLAIMYNRKICAYDKETLYLLNRLEIVEECAIPRSNFLEYDDINRVKDSDVLVLMMGFSAALFRKMHKFCVDNKTRIQPKEDDTFIVACPPSSRTEVLSAQTLDDLYRTGIHVVNISRKAYLSMHPSEEDIKSMISIFRPKYYLPVKGSYRDMIANAMIAYNMGIHLSHNNIFVLENGLVLDINNGVARVLPPSQGVKSGITYVDGMNQTSSSSAVISERLKLGEDGAIVIACALDANAHQIIAPVEVSLYGVTCTKDPKTVVRLLTNEATTALNEFLLGNINSHTIEINLVDRLNKLLKREIGKEPLIMPIIKIL